MLTFVVLAGFFDTRLAGLLLMALAPIAMGESCSPGLPTLTYPPLAIQARIMGTVTVGYVLTEDGHRSEMHIQGYPLLWKAVADALQSTPLLPQCAGQRVSVEVQFRLDEDSRSDVPVSVSRTSENTYLVIAPVPTIVISISDPPTWRNTRHGRFFHAVRRILGLTA